MDYGAVGDGLADDWVAVAAACNYAFDNGLPVDGGNNLYGCGEAIVVTGKTAPWIRRLRLKQMNPEVGGNLLGLASCTRVLIDSLYVHMGDNKTIGDLSSSVFSLSYGTGHRVKNVEATGWGMGTYVAFVGCVDSVFEDIYVHDGEFDYVAARDDVVQGIIVHDCRNCTLVNPVVTNLLGNATYFNTAMEVKTFRNLRTRGIAGGGNIGITVVNPKVTNVEQSIDFSGGGSNWGNRFITVMGGQSRNAGSCGVKFAGGPNGCKRSVTPLRTAGCMVSSWGVTIPPSKGGTASSSAAQQSIPDIMTFTSTRTRNPMTQTVAFT
jgi:hypothetical protein